MTIRSTAPVPPKRMTARSISSWGSTQVSDFRVPLLLRGEIIEGPTVAFGGRRGGVSFTAADVSAHMNDLTLSAPSRMADLYAISLEEIFDFLSRLGKKLHPADNPYLQESFELSRATSGLSDSILRHHYEGIPRFFERETVRDLAERLIGIDYLEGWVEQPRTTQQETASASAPSARGRCISSPAMCRWSASPPSSAIPSPAPTRSSRRRPTIR